MLCHICSSTETTIKQRGWGQWGAHWAATILLYNLVAEAKRSHVQRRCDNHRDLVNTELAGDIEASVGLALDGVPRCVFLAQANREILIITNIHLGFQKMFQHKPGLKKTRRFDAYKEACQVLVSKDKVEVGGN